MINQDSFTRLHQLLDQQHWTIPQVARKLHLNVKTVRLWATRATFQRQAAPPRASKLDVFKAEVIGLLAQHPFSAAQLLVRLRERGYAGGYTTLKDYLRQVRPPRRPPAFLTLAFAPGECAQIDWGCAGSLAVGATHRRLSFCVVLLCYSRLLYVEFTLSETLEQFLACQSNAWEYFGGAPQAVMIDNLKTAVLSHPAGQPAVLHPRYQDFARHYGFDIRACNVRAAHEKGRVENAVGYVKKNFLAGLDLQGLSLTALNTAAGRWREEVANVRLHGTTRQTPRALFATEQAHLRPLPAARADTSLVRSLAADRRFRIHFDGNRYSVPAAYAGARLQLHATAATVQLYHQQQLVAEHPRCYERGRDLEHPDHARPLLAERRRARDQQLLQRFLQLAPGAEDYYHQLAARRFNARQHVAQIVALSEIYGATAVARALADACEFQAFSAEYIANLLEQRARQLPEPGALHLTRRQDLLELDLPAADLNLYQPTTEPADQ